MELTKFQEAVLIGRGLLEKTGHPNLEAFSENALYCGWGMPTMGKYKTVKEVCALTGLTRKHLYYFHHEKVVRAVAYANYSVEDNDGYKLYDDSAVERLQQIALYYQLGLKRDEIRDIMLAPDYDSNRIDYFKCVAAQGLYDYDTWDDALGDFYDEWDDAMGEYYDAWDDAIGDVYDKVDDLISDASDDMDYSEYSDVWSAMYKEHSDAWSAMYELYSDAWSRTYEDYSACWGGFYEGNKDVDSILADSAKEENQGSENEDETQGNDATTSPNDIADTSGIRPEFKNAMDAYEAFYDEYCDILKQYYDNPTDMTLLTKYTELMTKAIEMDEAFAKWENEDLNNEELKYYLEVNNRVMQKLVDVVG